VNYIVEIVILAMIAAFLGMRLYSVLGERAEHEEEVIPNRYDPADQQQMDTRPKQAAAVVDLPRNPNLHPSVDQGVRAIAAADRSFDILTFLEGAKGAYAMVLEAFWRGNKETLRELCDLDVFQSFAGAIDAREELGQSLDNKLIRIEDCTIRHAELDGRTARVTVLFVSDIAAVTRDAGGHVIAGSLDDAIESRDIWTFKRNVDAAGPDWILDETDEG
jgi:predicted lipid-binding transport protein (Tim44 family)